MKSSLAVTVVLLTFLAPDCGQVRAAFTDVTLSSGIDYQQWTILPQNNEAMRMTGGAAAGDVDGDGYPDLFVTRVDGPDILYLNNQQGGFIDVSAESGFTASLNTNGAAMGDIDNDGDLDLYVTAVGGYRYYLYMNDGNGNFSEEAVVRNAGIVTDEIHYGTSAALGDYDNDGYLDLHVNEWGNTRFLPPSLWSHVRVLHNLGAENPGYFEDATLETGIYMGDIAGYGANDDRTGVFTFSSTFADFDRDGFADIAIAGDFNTSQLFWNNGDGTFDRAPGPFTPNPSGIGTDENGMGSAVADVNGDGLLDWFVTSIYQEDLPCPEAQCNWNGSGNRLYLNNGDRTFTDATDLYGVRDGSWGWGTVFFDYDNDGDLDLVMTNGMTGRHRELVPFKQDPMKLWRNDNGVFTEVAAEEGLTDTGSGKGLLTFDYDLDGDLDLFIVNNGGQPKLYRNETNASGAFLTIQTEGTVSNRDGIGTFLTLIADEGGSAQTRYVSGGTNFLSQSDLEVHFGLGDRTAPLYELVVEWPSGIRQVFKDIPVNSRLVIVEKVPEPVGSVLLLVGTLIAALRRNR
ncbi:MAG: CRTAC1 family protein [Planctomycetes bacterium]|nr:CRTAC1 family protein [Planctomycetota bacterium]